MFRLFRPKDSEHPDRRSQPSLSLHVSWRTDYQPLLGPHDRAGDGRRVRRQSLAGAARARERHDQDARHAAVYGPAPAPTGKRGRPALKGERLRSLAAVALASTDTDAATAQLIARYDSRWTIETCHQEAKAHGVGEARNRVQKAQRTVPVGFIAPTITITRVGA